MDATDQAILEEEGIRHMDAFIGLSDVDEKNIVMSLFPDETGKSDANNLGIAGDISVIRILGMD